MGFVINFNATTRAHIDSGDEDLCVVFPFSDLDERLKVDEVAFRDDGSLCFQELGIVLRMYSGDGIAFKSSKLTHFNLHIRGKQISIVFHADGKGRGWVKDRNGWAGNIWLSTEFSSDLGL